MRIEPDQTHNLNEMTSVGHSRIPEDGLYRDFCLFGHLTESCRLVLGCKLVTHYFAQYTKQTPEFLRVFLGPT